MGIILLLAAITGEVFASTMLKASNGFRRILPIFGLAIGYLISFCGLSLSLKTIPLAVAYAIWSGIGTAATVLIGVFFFKESFNQKKFWGITLIIVGVVVLNLSE